jgi:hypothetical protein
MIFHYLSENMQDQETQCLHNSLEEFTKQIVLHWLQFI